MNLTGPLEVNNLLDNSERLLEGQVHGPETLLKRDNDIYTTIHGGEVIKITGDHITHIAKFGKPCGKFWLKFFFIEIAFIVSRINRLYLIFIFHSIGIYFMFNRRFD